MGAPREVDSESQVQRVSPSCAWRAVPTMPASAKQDLAAERQMTRTNGNAATEIALADKRKRVKRIETFQGSPNARRASSCI